MCIGQFDPGLVGTVGTRPVIIIGIGGKFDVGGICRALGGGTKFPPPLVGAGLPLNPCAITFAFVDCIWIEEAPGAMEEVPQEDAV